MNVYKCHPITREFLGKVVLDESDKNPLKPDDYIIPANCFLQWPTVSAGDNQAIIKTSTGWALTPDFRGAVYWSQQGEKGEIDQIGISLPSDVLDYDPVALADEKTAKYEAEQEAQAKQAATEEVSTGDVPQ